MPAKVKVRILAGRNLPVMDKSSDASDAFVEVKLGNTTYKTEVYRRSLNPFWNSEWFRFEVNDQELQDEPLQIRIMDYDTYSANDAIGKVYINLNPLLLNPGRSMNGWLPIYDTLHGIRGEINCMVKVNLFADNNRYRHSSCGVRFFFSDIPNGYKCDAILGFVDELLVNDDPEYQWIDKIRTPRASNEARQTLFTKLSGEVQRKLGLKAEIFGGNAVIGYQQSFDLEGGSGIVGRGIGTAVVLSRIGHQYDEIISPLSLTNPNAPYPYYSPGQHIDRSTSHSFSLNRGPTSERHLVHSVSADFFYEVPSSFFRKRQESSVVSKSIMSDLSDQSDEETFVSLRSDDEYDDTDAEVNELDTDKNTLASVTSRSPSKILDNPTKKHLQTLNKSLILLNNNNNNNSDKTTPLKEQTARLFKRKSSGSLISKLLLLPISSDSITQKLAEMAKPAANISSATKLINKVTHRKGARPAGDQKSQRVNDTDQQQQQQQQHQPLGTTLSNESTSSQHHHPLQQRSTTSTSTDSSHTAPTTPSTSSAGPSSSLAQAKRKKEKSQSGGDDVLPIIEERIDDDDANSNVLNHLSSKGQASRIRLLSGSSARSVRQITRTKEIDLSGDNELALGVPAVDSKSLDQASVEDEDDGDMDDQLVASDTLSSSTIDGRTSNAVSSANQTESILSTSSPSTSLMTDETIRPRNRSTSPPTKSPKQLSAQQSVPTIANDHTNSQQKVQLMRRSDTDLAHSQLVADTSAKTLGAHHSQQQLKLINSSSPQPPTTGSGTNFIQSVRVVKAQQRLLQNMIKHQNENLVTHSMNKARNAFIYPSRIHQSEYPFVTLKRFPEGLILCTGGVVSVHSVKLLDHIINDEESETRDIWWTEIRKEIRSHAKALNCNTILGYSETSKVLGDVCILSARGTAAVMKPLDQMNTTTTTTTTTTNNMEANNHNKRDRSASLTGHQTTPGGNLKVPRLNTSSSPPPSHSSMPPPPIAITSASKINDSAQDKSEYPARLAATNQDTSTVNIPPVIDCSFCHSPLVCVESIGSLANCSICNSSKVPDVLLLTIEPPKNLIIVSASNLVQARVCRTKRDSHGEASAKEIGDALPFLEYELHRQLFSKLKFKGLNCLFNLSIDISVGENMFTGVATGTGCFVLGLPSPEIPQISAGKGIKASKLDEIRNLIALSAIKNRENLQLQQIELQLAKYRHQVDHMNSLAMGPIEDTRPVREPTPTMAAAAAVAAAASAAVPDSSRKSIDGDHQSMDLLKGSASGDVNQASTSQMAPMSVVPIDLSGDNSSGWDSRTNKYHYKTSTDDETNLGSIKRSHASTNPHHHHSHHHHRHHNHNHNHNHHHHHHNHHHHKHQHHHHHHHRKSPRFGARSVDRGTPSGAAPAENLINMSGDENNIVLEVDDNEDADIIALLIDSDIPDGYLVCNSETTPTINQDSIASINMFTQVLRVKLTAIDQFAQQFDWIIQALMVKQRRSLPCCLTNLNFVVDLPESHVVQITVTGCVLGLHSSPTNTNGASSSAHQQSTPVAAAVSTNNSNTPADDKQQQHLQPPSDNKQQRQGSSTSMSPTSLSPSSKSSSSSPGSSSSSSESSGDSSTTTTTTTGSRSSSSHNTSSSSSTTTKSTSKSSSKTPKPTASDQLTGAKSSLDQSTTTNDVPTSTARQSITKNLSKGNLAAAIITAGKSTFGTQDKKAAKTVEKIELCQQSPVAEPTQHEIRATIKDDLMQSTLGQKSVAKQPTRGFRAVFKKQQTYPGANSPAITGQDDLFAELISRNNQTTTSLTGPAAPSQGNVGAAANSGGSSTSRKATNLLNKVKQPLRDLGSNFNSLSSSSPAAVATTMDGQHQEESNGGGASNSNKTSSSSRLTSQARQSSDAAAAAAGPTPKVMTRSTSMASSSNHQQPSATEPSVAANPGTTTTSAGGSAGGGGQQHHHNHNHKFTKTATNQSSPKKPGEHHRSLNSSIDITSLSYIPGAKEYHYLGNLTFSFVRETNSVRENGGLNGFIQCFLMEVYAIVRAHVSALGGNAFLSFRLQQSCIFYHSNKNQAQCLISVAGDAVQVITTTTTTGLAVTGNTSSTILSAS